MAFPEIATLATGTITNSSVYLRGESWEWDGWECIQWGFYCDKEQPLTTFYNVADPGEGIFSKFVGGLDPYSLYYYVAYGNFRRWNVEEEEYDYSEQYGMIENFTTHAYCTTLQIFACNINKVTGMVTFHGDCTDTDGGNCVERGFEYGLTRTNTWEVHENGNFPVAMFSLPAYGLPLNCDFYVRTYLKSSSGHYSYTGDGYPGGWMKFTTKILNYEIAMTSSAGWYGGLANFFLRALNENGQEVNSWPLPVGQEAYQVTVDTDGYVYYGQITGGVKYVSKRRLNDGSLINNWASVGGTIRGLCIGKDNYLYVLEYKTLYKRSKEDYSEIAKINLDVGFSYACGITLDKDNYIYLGRTTGTDRIEKYKFFTNYDIIGVVTGESEGSFTIEGDHASEFTDLDDITIAGSTGNDGNYPVANGGAFLDGDNTIVPVRIGVPDPTVDGNLTKSGVGEMMASINSPVDLIWGGLAVIGENVYAGARFDPPVKTDKDLTSIAKWYPSGGNWYSGWWFFYLGVYKENILVEGATNGDYMRAVAGYNESETQLWYTELVRGIESVNGYPFRPYGATIINTKAEKRAGSLTLYGEITEKVSENIVERGFEYKVQDAEPGEEDTGTEVKEIGSFEIGVYGKSSWDTFNDLYQAEADIIWWFRAYCKDDGENKYKVTTWMRNVPVLVTSECTETLLFSTKGHGELTDIGANIVTERGFHVIKEFSGDISDLHYYTWHGFVVVSLESTPQYAPNGVLIGFLWVGELLKTVSTTYLSGYPLEEYDLVIGTGILDALLPNDTYKVKAFGKNELGRGFGGEVEITTLQLIFEPEEDEPIVSPTTAIKTVKVDNLPDGYKVVRIGIKYGRTRSCNEGLVYQDGEWYNGDSVTFFIVDLIPGEKYYESPFMTVEDPEGEQDEIEDPENDDFPDIELPEWPEFPDIHIPLPDLVGIDYAIIIKEIRCSIIADQSIIDKYGRRRTLTIRNNLIQTKEFCVSVRDDYLNRFQELKLKIDIDYDIPLPFEREDTILLSYGQILYKADGNGVIGAKADGEGVISGKMSTLTKIRKININAKTEEAILTLELEV